MFVANPIAFDDDPIFALSREASARITRGERCINATLGVLINDDGRLAVMPTVAEVLCTTPAVEWAAYATTMGLEDYCNAVADDCFRAHPKLRERAVVVATPGATGALRNAMMTFLGRNERYLTSSLCWGAYSIIARATERRHTTFEMFDGESQRFNVADLDHRLDQIIAEQGRALIVLNDPCHNPSGYSMSTKDWSDVAEVLRRHSARAPVTLVLDSVYSTFAAAGMERALAALEPLADQLLIAIAWSGSKTFTGYGLRAGALVVATPNPRERQQIRDTLACHSCGTWANCNRGGLVAMTRLLTDPGLRASVDRDRAAIIELLRRRSALFDAVPAARALRRPKYDGGFFTSVFVHDPARVAAELRREGCYVVPIEGGLRIALSAVRTCDVTELANRVASAAREPAQREWTETEETLDEIATGGNGARVLGDTSALRSAAAKVG